MVQKTVDIERVVREVLAELQQQPQVPGPTSAAVCTSSSVPVPSPVAPPCPPPAVAVPVETKPEGELTLDCRVVTLRQIEGRLAGTRRVVVPTGAIVTPAVRDELLRRNIALAFADQRQAYDVVAPRLVAVAHGSRFDPASLAAALTKDGIAVEPHQCDCLIASTAHLAEEVQKPNTLGLLLTRHVAAALCLANRHGGVRAVAGTDLRAAAAAVEAVGANLLVVDPSVGGFFQLKRMAGEFGRVVRPCPDVFREKLC